MTEDSLTHLDAQGAARMVAIQNKAETPRHAIAQSRISMAVETLERVRSSAVEKGDVLAVARLAAIAAAKATGGLIPLCHPVRLTGIQVSFRVLDETEGGPAIESRVEVHAVDRTGPEMEAMTAASTAALAIYDMCKGMERGMSIEHVVLLEKAGGKSGLWTRDESG